MYPYLEIFGVSLYMTGIGIVISCIVFLVTAWVLCKKYHQDFIKLFNWLPWLLIPVYILGLYVSFILQGGGIIPPSLSFLSPHGYNFSFIGILLGCFVSILFFLRQFRRNETKKIWIDILFFSFCNAMIPLGVFLLLGDNFIGMPYWGALSVRALIPESELVKYGTVYPVGLFLSLWCLAINVVITIRKLLTKKVGIWIWGFIMIFILFILLLPFRNYPAHGVISLFGKISLDINYYVLVFLICYCLLRRRKLRKPFN